MQPRDTLCFRPRADAGANGRALGRALIEGQRAGEAPGPAVLLALALARLALAFEALHRLDHLTQSLHLLPRRRDGAELALLRPRGGGGAGRVGPVGPVGHPDTSAVAGNSYQAGTVVGAK